MKKPRAVVDTNFFYYLAGVESDPRLRPDWQTALEEEHILSLASPTIVEILTRQDMEESKLWTCLDSVFSGRFRDVIQIGYLPFDVEPLEKVARERDREGLRHIQADALRQKVQCEVEFLRFVLMVLLGGFLHALLEDRRADLTGSEQASLALHFEALMEANSDAVAAALTEVLIDGCGTRDATKVVEKTFHNQLKSFAFASLVNLHGIRLGLESQELAEASPELRRQISEAVQADPLLIQLGSWEGNPIGVLRKKKFRESVNGYLEEMTADLRHHSTMPAEVLRFFVNRLRRDVLSGAKFRKNDVIDLLLAYSVIVDDTVFVTNDDDVLAAMETASPRSYEVGRSLLLEVPEGRG